MIKQYFEYKRKVFGDLINLSTSKEETEKHKKEYEEFLKNNLRKDDKGNIIVSKSIAEDIIKLIKERKIPLVMDKYDKQISLDVDMPNSKNYNGPYFTSISDVIAVHKTPIYPVNDTIITQENSGLTSPIVFRNPYTGEEYCTNYLVGNDTTHFTLNCVVKNHEMGNDWDSYKYAVMIGLDKLEKAKILDVKTEDTYIDGDAYLKEDYYIFCPFKEKEEIKKANPNSTIIEYDGITLNEAVEAMIIYSGKKLESYGAFGWRKDSEFSPTILDNISLNKLLEKENYPNLNGPFGPLMHSESKYMARRMWKREYEAIISLINCAKEKGLNMPEQAIIGLIMIAGAYCLPGTVPVSLESYKQCVLPILEKYGYKVEDDFFDGIESCENDMKIIIKLPDENGFKRSDVQCPNWEHELRSRVIELVKSKNIKYGDETVGKVSKP